MRHLTAIAVVAGILAAGCAARFAGGVGGGGEEAGKFEPLAPATEEGTALDGRPGASHDTSLRPAPEAGPREDQGREELRAEPPESPDQGPGNALPNFLFHRDRYEALSI